jgi:hypothetical protein
VSPRFLAWARSVAEQHQAATGSPIDLATLIRKLKVNPDLGRAVHAHLQTATTGA